MTPTTGILTSLLNDFQSIYIKGIINIKGNAIWLLGALMAIDLILAVLLNLGNEDQMKFIIQKVLLYGFFVYIIADYSHLLNILRNSFSMIGIKAGGNGITLDKIADPSSIAEYGMYVAKPIFKHVSSYHGWGYMFNLGDIINSYFCGWIIVFAFGFIGIQFFITYLEFYLIGCVALILIPFGVNKHTAFIGEKAIASLISFGIKLMVLSFIASAAIPLVHKWAMPDNPSLDVMAHTLFGSLAIALLAWQAPNLAMSLLNGAPSISASTLAGGAMAGVGAAVGAKMAAGNIIGGGMRAAGAISQAARMGAANGGSKGAVQSVGKLLAANSSFGQGQSSALQTMARHNRAMSAASMNNRMLPDKGLPKDPKPETPPSAQTMV